MNRINSFTKIKSIYPDLAPSEKSVADYILTHPEEIYKLNIQDLAKRSDVSLPTVFRFTKRLGFSGYKDFKIELVKDIGVGLHISPMEIEGESTEGITKAIFEKEINNLQETLSNINYTELQRAVDSVMHSDRLLFFAVSSSLSVAFDFYWKFSLAGFSCFYNADIYTQKILSTQCRRGDLAIGISFSGETAQTVDCLRNAQENKALTLSVTTFMNSAITKYSDITLLTAPVLSLYQKIDLPSKVSQTAILDVLYLLAVLKNRERATRFISKAEEELSRSKGK
jgi:DNA-binding MurR/RpiR family transcriptional regulator